MRTDQPPVWLADLKNRTYGGEEENENVKGEYTEG